MAEGQTDVKPDGQAVDAQQAAVSQSDTGTQTDGVKLADGQSAADKTVPYSRFAEVNAAAKEAKEAAEAAKAEADMLRQQVMAQQPQQAQQPTDLFSQTVKRLGLENETYLDKDQQGAVFNAMMDTVSTNQANVAFMQSHPDFAQVVGSYDARGNFIPAAPLQRVMSRNPYLRQAILSSPQAGMLAYELASKDPDYLKSKEQSGMTEAEKAAADAKAIADAAARQGSISAAGTGGGNVDRAAQIRAMSDEEFHAYKEAIKARAV